MEILIRVIDNGSAIDASKAGEVIVDRPDGWCWSDLERTELHWRIIKAPLLQAHVNMLMAQHTTSEQRQGNKIYPRMANLLDLTKLPTPERFKGDRGPAHIELTAQDVLNAVVKVPV